MQREWWLSRELYDNNQKQLQRIEGECFYLKCKEFFCQWLIVQSHSVDSCQAKLHGLLLYIPLHQFFVNQLSPIPNLDLSIDSARIHQIGAIFFSLDCHAVARLLIPWPSRNWIDPQIELHLCIRIDTGIRTDTTKDPRILGFQLSIASTSIDTYIASAYLHSLNTFLRSHTPAHFFRFVHWHISIYPNTNQ